MSKIQRLAAKVTTATPPKEKKPLSNIEILLDAANMLHAAKYSAFSDIAFRRIENTEKEIRKMIRRFQESMQEKERLAKKGDKPQYEPQIAEESS